MVQAKTPIRWLSLAHLITNKIEIIYLIVLFLLPFHQ